MIPTEVLKNEVIKTPIKSITSTDVLIRERYNGVPLQPINSAILLLCSYEVNTLLLTGSITKEGNNDFLKWRTCKLVAKGEYVNGLNLGDNVYAVFPTRVSSTVIFSEDNDYSSKAIRAQYNSLTPPQRTEETKNNPKTIVYEYFLLDASQISGIVTEDREDETNQLALELESTVADTSRLR